MIVIADDITGAAEIAGIAHEQGRTVKLFCGETPTEQCLYADIVVLATDTRSMSEAEAVDETKRLATSLRKQGIQGRKLFKKVDSALRGHVVAELTTLMDIMGYRRAVYLPANPSKGRLLCKGIYTIQGVPIHETAFSYDPEYPAFSSMLSERFPDAESHHIVMPDTESVEDLQNTISIYHDEHTLFAGAADLFVCLTKAFSEEYKLSKKIQNPPSLEQTSWTLFLCGSTQSKPVDWGLSVVEMPRGVYDGEQSASDWFETIPSFLLEGQGRGLMLTMPYTHRTDRKAAVYLRETMAQMARLLMACRLPQHLIIEGGATAWATLRALGWTNLMVTAQLAPGVVRLQASNGVQVTLKPGSYPWNVVKDF